MVHSPTGAISERPRPNGAHLHSVDGAKNGQSLPQQLRIEVSSTAHGTQPTRQWDEQVLEMTTRLDQRTSKHLAVTRMRLLANTCDGAIALVMLVFAWPLQLSYAPVIPVLWLGLMLIRTTRSGRIADIFDLRRYAKTNAHFVLVMVASAALLSDLVGTRLTLGISVALAAAGLGSRAALNHPVVRRLLDMDNSETVIVVGSREGVGRTIAEWEHNEAIKVVGVCLAEDDRGPRFVKGVPVLGSAADVADVVDRIRVDIVALHDVDHLGGLQLARLHWALEEVGTQLSVITPMTNMFVERARVRRLGRRVILDVAYSRPRGLVKVLKGVIEQNLCLAFLLVLAPVVVVCALAVKLTSPGPVFFRQTRVGEGGQTFTMYKLRTMQPDAESHLADLLDANEVGGGLFKIKNDPRVTNVGRVLRRLSLDELPQLWNVVLGQMSLIGPRPALPREVETYDDAARRRLAVKPGLTGLWQVSGRSNLSWDETVRIDSDYVDNWRPGREFSIVVRTVKAVLSKEGAH